MHAAPDLVVLRSPDIQLTVHAIPPAIAADIVIADPPVPRDGAAFKFFFTVRSLADAASHAPALGGRVLPETWQGPGFLVRNTVDPEGNIFQLRERTSG